VLATRVRGRLGGDRACYLAVHYGLVGLTKQIGIDNGAVRRS